MDDYDEAEEFYSEEAEDFEEDEIEEDELEDLPVEDLDDPDDDPDYYDPEELQAEVQYLESLSDEEDDEEDEDLMNEDMDGFLQDLRAAQGYKTKSKGKTGRKALGEAPLTPELRALMGQVNQAYVQRDLETCRTLILQVVQKDPGIYSAWKILGEIFFEKGDNKRCLQCWIMAAMSKPRETQLWLDCAKMSRDIYGPGEQVVLCLSKALKYNKGHVEAMFERALCYKDMGWNGKSLDAFKAILKIRPNDFMVLGAMGKVLQRVGKANEAIKMFLEALNVYMAAGTRQGFGWSDLNLLVELYMSIKDWKQAVFAARNYARWLYLRDAETYWDEVEKDDREYDANDKRRSQIKHYQPGKFSPVTYTLPLEIRVNLGVCRMKLGNKDEAIHHFSFLKDTNSYNPLEYTDILSDTGDLLLEHELFIEALTYYRIIIDAGHFDRKVFLNLAKCYRELSDAVAAEDAYMTIIRHEPQDVDARMQLAVLLEADDRREEALELVNEIIALKKPSAPRAKSNTARARRAGRRNKTDTGGETEEQPDEAMDENAPSASIDSRGLLVTQNPRKPSRARRAELTAEQKRFAEEKKREQTKERYDRLEALGIAMEAGNPSAVKEWLDTAADLVDSFRNTRAFYPNERKTQFTGFTSAAKRRAAAQSQEVALQRIQNRLEESLEFQEAEIEKTEDLTSYHGLDFETWLSIFCRYALCLTQHEDPKDAYDVLLAAIDANVFYHNLEFRRRIHTVQLACALLAKDTEACSEYLRAWMINHQFRTDVYRLFAAAFLILPQGYAKFKDGANQKFFLRQIKALDKALLGRDIPGASALTAKNPDGTTFIPESHDPMLFALYGHVLTGGRGFISALSYYSRGYGLRSGRREALYCGLAYLHRSMQRQSQNRQWEVLQSLSFLFEYYDGRPTPPTNPEDDKEGLWLETQEAEFNLGRAFHQLGLGHLAEAYYKKALEISERYNKEGKWDRWDLKAEAAYNLQMVYFVGGDGRGAVEVSEKYLVL